MKTCVLFSILFLFQGAASIKKSPSICLTQEEKKLYDMMMAYRKTKGLEPVRLSEKLTRVAQTHAIDLSENYKFDVNNKCNPHSWSSKGKWSDCCYTSDHKQAKCMWDKPNEIAQYQGAGYEIAYYSSAGATANEGLEGWKNSPSHNPLIMNEGMWSKVAWRGIGIGIYKEYGVVWFGELEDKSILANCANP